MKNLNDTIDGYEESLGALQAFLNTANLNAEQTFALREVMGSFWESIEHVKHLAGVIEAEGECIGVDVAQRLNWSKVTDVAVVYRTTDDECGVIVSTSDIEKTTYLKCLLDSYVIEKLTLKQK